MTMPFLSYIRTLKNGTQQVQYIPDYFSEPMIKMFAEATDGTKYCFPLTVRGANSNSAYPTFAALVEGVGSAFSTKNLPMASGVNKPWVEANKIQPQTIDGYTGEYVIVCADEYDLNIINAKLSETNATFNDFINNP